MFIDSHAHLTCDPVFEGLEGILERANRRHIQAIINICTDKKTLDRGLALNKTEPFVYNVGATTPHDVEKEGELYFPFFEEAAKSGQLVAVGETGLDYFYEHSNKEVQKTFLKKYLNLALTCHLPVVIHCRDAFQDLFETIDREFQIQGKSVNVVLHCFTGTMEEAQEGLKRGWWISFSGILTFKKSSALREVAKVVPLEKILLAILHS